nr:MAG TPA: antitoxin [Caudoviricetes sp.]
MASGGAREGAGRKKLDANKKKLNKTFRIDPQLFKEIESKYPNEKLTNIIEKALIEYLKKN